jgi:hypothetical protein
VRRELRRVTDTGPAWGGSWRPPAQRPDRRGSVRDAEELIDRPVGQPADCPVARASDQATASDHVVCTVTSTITSTALCDGSIAIGGSMIFGDDFVLNFISNAATTVKITGGTGVYRHAHGAIIVKPVGDNNDLNNQGQLLADPRLDPGCVAVAIG